MAFVVSTMYGDLLSSFQDNVLMISEYFGDNEWLENWCPSKQTHTPSTSIFIYFIAIISSKYKNIFILSILRIHKTNFRFQKCSISVIYLKYRVFICIIQRKQAMCDQCRNNGDSLFFIWYLGVVALILILILWNDGRRFT